MNMKRLLSLLLSFAMVAALLCCPITSSATKDFTYKIEDALAEKLDDMEDDEVISVSVWFSDIDYDAVQKKVIEEVEDTVSNDVLDIIKANGDETELISLYEEEQDKTISEQKKESLEMQTAIEAEREIAAEMQVAENEEHFAELFSETSDSRSATDNSEEPEVIYSCKYAPNIDMYLTKSQIEDIITSDIVENIYYYDPDVQVTVDSTETEEATDSTDDETVYDMSYFSTTGLSSTRDAYGLYGYGVNVGVYDAGFCFSSDVDYFENDNISDSSYINNSVIYDDTATHGNFVSCIIGGYKTSSSGKVLYSGAVPRATMYWSGGYGYKECVEFLIESGCNVINMSLGLTSNTTYDACATWFDHVSTYHSVHLVFSAGNYGADTIYSPKTSYNAIVVGNCNNSGTIMSSSSYSTSETMPYKPDVVAPGNSISTPAATAGGTSASAPMVTSAVAQFCQLSSVLRSNPTLMKALILAGSKRTSDMISDGVASVANETSIAFSRVYGSGILNTNNMYVAFNDYSRYITGTMSSTDYLVTSTQSVTKSVGKQLRVAVVWDKVSEVSSDDHKDDDTVTGVDNDVLLLTVIDPDGTTYDTYYLYDTKALISFSPTVNGTYTFQIRRLVNSGEEINYSLAYSINNE